MNTFKTAGALTFQAIQYGMTPEGDAEARKYVKKCYKNYSGKIVEVPRDMMGTPKDAFLGVETAAGWRAVEVSDYIIVAGEQVHLVSEEFFNFMNAELVV